MRGKHGKKRSSPLVWSFVLTLLLIAAVAAVLHNGNAPAEATEPAPVGTPNHAPVAAQKPVPPAGSAPPAAPAPGAPAAGSGASSAAQGGGTPSSSQPSAPSAVPETPVPGIDAKDGEQVVRGVIVDATTSSVTIQTAEGTQLSFMRETADVTGRLVEEAEAEIYYVGAINGTDTSAAFVTKIIAFA